MRRGNRMAGVGPGEVMRDIGIWFSARVRLTSPRTTFGSSLRIVDSAGYLPGC